MINFDKIAEDFEKNKEVSEILSFKDQFKNEYDKPFVLETESCIRKFNYDVGEYFRKMNELLKKISAMDILAIEYKEEALSGWKHKMDIYPRDNIKYYIEDFNGFCVRSLSDGHIYSGVIVRALYEYKEVSSDFEKDMEDFCFEEFMNGGTIKEACLKFLKDYMSNRFITKSLDVIGSVVIASENNKLEIWERK